MSLQFRVFLVFLLCTCFALGAGIRTAASSGVQGGQIRLRSHSNIGCLRGGSDKRSLSLRGGKDSGSANKDSFSDDADGENMFERLASKLQALRSDEDRTEAIMDELCGPLPGNLSQPDNYMEASHKMAMGLETMSANWTCLRCGVSSLPYLPVCHECGIWRSDAEFAVAPEELGMPQPILSCHAVRR